ncbi:ABC transporter ATP-binding protein/permease [Candidatus Pelagibacter bacterium]|nr:ABC transporter ATP-binding protein/permease [Candidatus Pelagibacter bacterium]
MISRIIHLKSFLNLFEKIDKKYFYIIIFLTVFTVFLETLSIGLIIPIIQIILSDDAYLRYLEIINLNNLFQINKSNLIIFSLALMIGIYTLKASFLTFFSYIENKLLSKIKVNLSKKLFSLYINSSYLFHVKTNTSELTRNLLDLKRISAILTASSTLLTEFLVLICVMLLLFYYEPTGTFAVIVIFSIFALIFYLKVQKNARIWGMIRKNMQAKIINNINNSFRSIKEIKMFKKENYFIDNFFENSKKEIDAELNKQAFINSLPRFWFEWLTVISLISLLIIMIFFKNYNEEKIIPIIGLFAAASFRLMPSIVRIMQTLQKIKFNLPIIEGVLEEISMKNNLQELYLNSKEKIISNNFKKIKFDKINFNYESNNQGLIKNLSFDIKINEILGISGKSGSGKTTLINIISGLLKINSGKVLVDDQLIQGNIKFSKNIIGYVPQRIYLLDDTIKNNIAFGESENSIDDKKILDLVINVKLKELIDKTNNGIDSNIGEFGDKLSGGQIQRLGLARALYLSPKILILDESTNALDADTEKSIFDYLLKIKSNLSIIIVSHKKSILEKCDKIIELK